MWRRSILLMLLAALLAPVAHADPGVDVVYRDGLLRVTLAGSYGGTYYRVWRSGELLGQYSPLASQYTLCTGDCFVTDAEARPGVTYFYRFELITEDRGIVSFGPYPVTIADPPAGARLSPNPSSGTARVEFTLPGVARRDAPLPVDARIVDLQGRTVRVLLTGPLARGVTSLAWDGRGDSGRPIAAGVYFLRFATPVGASVTRVVRVR